MIQGEDIRSDWGSREKIRKIRIARKIRNKRARALWPIDIIDNNLSSYLNRASETT
jgi:hypothetical protein